MSNIINLIPNFIIPYSRYVSFYNEWNNNEEWQKHLRYGQALYNYLNLYKMNQTPFLDALYNEPDRNKVQVLINSAMDLVN